MQKIRKYKNVVERFLSGEGGQRFFNIAYSLGAAVVILGALFKILHLSGGDVLLSVGMGTEVLMFVLTAFDRPQPDHSMPSFITGGVVGAVPAGDEAAVPASEGAHVQTPASSGVAGGGTVIIAGGGVGTAAAAPGAVVMPPVAGAVAQPHVPALEGVEDMTDGVRRLGATIEEYVGKMEDLNRSLAGLNAIYEMQLRGASAQMDSAGSVRESMRRMQQMCETTAANSAEYSEEARRLTENIRHLNRVYARMLDAMTHNPLAAAMPVEPEKN